MNRDERLKAIRAENEARYREEKAANVVSEIACISLTPLAQVKAYIGNLYNQPIEIKEA